MVGFSLAVADVRYVASRVAKRAWSSDVFLVFGGRLAGTERLQGEHADPRFRTAGPNDLEALVEVFPRELSRNVPRGGVERLFRSRLQGGAVCFVALGANGVINGAAWCLPPRFSSLRDFAALPAAGWYESANVFVVPSERGRRLSEHLLMFASEQMQRAGFAWVVSQVLVQRSAMVRINICAGRELLGVRTQESRLGFRKWRDHIYRNARV